jgi:hypothetical protein
MLTSRDFVSTREEKNSTKFWVGERPNFEAIENGNFANLQSNNPPVKINPQTLPQIQNIVPENSDCENFKTPTPEEIQNSLVLLMLKKLTGKDIDVKQVNLDLNVQVPDIQINIRMVNGNQGQRAGWGLEIDRSFTINENESSTFTAAGIIKTADGKEIAIEADLTLSRSFMQTQNINVRAGDAVAALKDPLVINFSGTAAQLTDQKMSFDINTDGIKENISTLASGSGYLALDSNSNGIIDNGSELFGPTTGNGFIELAKYDSDGNNWIDESDSIFNQLKIWTNEQESQLFSLKEKNIGAIYLGNAGMQFSYTDGANQLQGMNRSAGIFLSENGLAGTLQQIDLAV